MKNRFPSLLLISVLAAASQLKAELLIGLTIQNSLITFDSATPGTITAPVAIGGLLAGEVLVGIDRRPQNGPNNGVLYGLGVNNVTGSGRIYTLNVTTGAATPGSLLSADPADSVAPTPYTNVSGNFYGVDFNPVVDRLRVVSSTGQNLRINVDNGLVQLDVPLTFLAGDANFGQAPAVGSVAYANNFGGTLTTELRGIHATTTPDSLVTFANPNGGTLMTVGALPFDATLGGYDISGLTGIPYFAVTSAGGPSQLYSGATLTGTIGGGVQVIGLAAQVGLPQSAVPDGGTTIALFLTSLLGLGIFARKKRLA